MQTRKRKAGYLDNYTREEGQMKCKRRGYERDEGVGRTKKRRGYNAVSYRGTGMRGVNEIEE